MGRIKQGILFSVVCVLVFLFVALSCWGTQADWFFTQRDSRWAADPMGSSSCTIGNFPNPCGCAMTALAMILRHAGSDADPKKLNTWLGPHNGYNAIGEIHWGIAANYDGSGGVIYRGSSNTYNNWNELARQLEQGRLVIVKVDINLTTYALEGHWVLVTGKIGSNTSDPSSYSINDPWDYEYTDKTLAYYYDTYFGTGNTFFAMRYYSGPWVDTTSLPSPIHVYPTVNAFSVGPGSLVLGDSFTIRYKISDTGGSGLNWVQLWRAADTNSDGKPDWPESYVEIYHLSGQTNFSGVFFDSPSSAGTYWYGVHVGDNNGNWSVEPKPPGPIRVTVR